MVSDNNMVDQLASSCTWTTLVEHNFMALKDLLDSFDPPKAIVWHRDLMSPMRLVAGYSVIEKQLNVAQQMSLDGAHTAVAGSIINVLYIMPPTVGAIKAVCERLAAVVSTGGVEQLSTTRRHHIVFVPTESILCETYMKQNNVMTRFNSMTHMDVHLYPLDVDVVSMEAHTLLRSTWLHADWSPMYRVAQAMRHLCRVSVRACTLSMGQVYGRPTLIDTRGEWAAKVYELFNKLSDGGGGGARTDDGASASSVTIDHMILIDRMVDVITPMLTQLTYTALIDELFTIKTEIVELPRDAFPTAGDEQSPTAPVQPNRRIRLHARDDALYADVRDAHIHAVPAVLSRHIRQLAQLEQTRHDARTVREYADFVRRLPILTAAKAAATTHTTIAELIKAQTQSDEFVDRLTCEQELLNGIDTDKCSPLIEDLIARAYQPLHHVLRLVCLQSHVNDGLRARTAADYERALCASYGHDTIVPMWLCLQRARLLLVRDTPVVAAAQPAPVPYAQLRKQHRLIIDDADEQTPTDAAYAYSGYAPLSVRVLTAALTAATPPSTTSSPRAQQPRTVCVFFVGGCTYGELAALRFVTKRMNVNLLIATTAMMNGKTIIDSMG